MLIRLRNNPWPTSLLAFLLYLAWFLVPGIVGNLGNVGGEQPAPVPPVTEIEYMVAQLPNQIGLIILVTGIVALLIWFLRMLPMTTRCVMGY